MQRKIAVLPRIGIAGLVDEGERSQQQRHGDEESIGNSTVGLQTIGAAPVEYTQGCVESHEDSGDITGLDADGEEEATDLAESRLGLDDSLRELGDGVDHELGRFEHVALHQEHDETAGQGVLVGWLETVC